MVRDADPQSFVFVWKTFSKDSQALFAIAHTQCQRIAVMDLSDKKLKRLRKAVDKADSSLTHSSLVMTLTRLLFNLGDKEKRDDASANSRWLKARAELDAAIQQVAETDKRLFQAESALISVRNIDSKSFHSMGVGMARDKRFLYSCEPGGQ